MSGVSPTHSVSVSPCPSPPLEEVLLHHNHIESDSSSVRFSVVEDFPAVPYTYYWGWRNIVSIPVSILNLGMAGYGANRAYTTGDRNPLVLTVVLGISGILLLVSHIPSYRRFKVQKLNAEALHNAATTNLAAYRALAAQGREKKS